MKPDISSRKDVEHLVSTFYSKVRVDEELGPIFNQIVIDWDTHLKTLTDFWESNIFLEKKYKGNPILHHQKVDEKINHGITQEHFARWLQLWFVTIDSLFDGNNANIAKNRARKMSTFMFIRIFQHRKDKKA